MLHLLTALLIATTTAHSAEPLFTRANDPCTSHCSLEPAADGTVKVLCACKEKKLPGGGDFFSLRTRAPAKFRLDLQKRLRGATEEETKVVAENACAESAEQPLCRCVHTRLKSLFQKKCQSTGAGETACEFSANSSQASEQRGPTLQDYQACIANRLTYLHETCLGEICSAYPDAYDGGGDVAAWKIQVSPDFRKNERAVVEAGVAALPACWKPAFEKIRVSRNRLPYGTFTKGKVKMSMCEPGRALLEKDEIVLDPVCGVNPGVVVHEFFHVLDDRFSLFELWMKVDASYPGCGVTRYGRTNLQEDFAEAGRLLMYPGDNGVDESKVRKPCVEAKLEALRRILNRCPEQRPAP